MLELLSRALLPAVSLNDAIKDWSRIAYQLAAPTGSANSAGTGFIKLALMGQDGAYLAEFLLHKGYEVHGIKRRASLLNTDRIDHLYRGAHEKGARFFLHPGELNDWQPPIKNYSRG